MNPEELKYYSHPKMREFFAEKMGEWKVGDRVAHIKKPLYGFIVTPESYRGYVKIRFVESESMYVYKDFMAKNLLRIPLPIDPVNPERGLMGMIEGFAKDDSLYVSQAYKGLWSCGFVNSEDIYHHWEGTTLSLALLKALAAQINAEVEQ